MYLTRKELIRTKKAYVAYIIYLTLRGKNKDADREYILEEIEEATEAIKRLDRAIQSNKSKINSYEFYKEKISSECEDVVEFVD